MEQRRKVLLKNPTQFSKKTSSPCMLKQPLITRGSKTMLSDKPLLGTWEGSHLEQGTSYTRSAKPRRGALQRGSVGRVPDQVQKAPTLLDQPWGHQLPREPLVVQQQAGDIAAETVRDAGAPAPGCGEHRAHNLGFHSSSRQNSQRSESKHNLKYLTHNEGIILLDYGRQQHYSTKSYKSSRKKVFLV